MKVVLCNCPVDKAEAIATSLVEGHYAACVNIIPLIQSVFHWQGKLCKEPESTLLIKIKSGDFAELEKQIRRLHPYEVPEIVELDVTDVHRPYLEWVDISTRRPPPLK